MYLLDLNTNRYQRLIKVISLVIGTLITSRTLAAVDCSNEILCQSYDFGLPVSITTTGAPALTTMGGPVGVGTVAPVRGFHVGSNDGMRLAPSALPSAPGAGDLVIDSSSNNELKYYNGSAWISATGGGSGSGGIASIDTGAGLSGGPITTSGTISLATAGITTVHLSDESVTDAKIAQVGVNKFASSAGQYFTYAPNGASCAANETLVWQNARWECGNNQSGATSPLTTKGDIYSHNGVTSARLPVGADGKVLVADSASPNGIAWSEPASGDLPSLTTTGIVHRDGPSAYSTITVASPLSLSGGVLSVDLPSGGGSGDFLADGSIPMTGNFELGFNWISNGGGDEGVSITPAGAVSLGMDSGMFDGAFANDPTVVISRSQNSATPYLAFLHANTDTSMIGIDSGDYFTMASESSQNGIRFRVNGIYDSSQYIDDAPIAMTITNNGNVGIGITNPTHILQINGQGRSTNSSWATTSDTRLKDLLSDYEYGLEEILKMKTVWFKYKKDNPLSLPSDKKYSGVVAQEMQKIIPEAVTEGDDGYLTLNSDPIHWATINALQELWTQMTRQDDRVSQLEAENLELKKRLEALEKRLL